MNLVEIISSTFEGKATEAAPRQHGCLKLCNGNGLLLNVEIGRNNEIENYKRIIGQQG